MRWTIVEEYHVVNKRHIGNYKSTLNVMDFYGIMLQVKSMMEEVSDKLTDVTNQILNKHILFYTFYS